MSDITSSAAVVVADTIVRTVELEVTITDAAVDGEATVVFCELLDDGQRSCPSCSCPGRYRDTVIRPPRKPDSHCEALNSSAQQDDYEFAQVGAAAPAPIPAV
jgi:hypothetical protein